MVSRVASRERILSSLRNEDMLCVPPIAPRVRGATQSILCGVVVKWHDTMLMCGAYIGHLRPV